jgi:hypothetical protein
MAARRRQLRRTVTHQGRRTDLAAIRDRWTANLTNGDHYCMIVPAV